MLTPILITGADLTKQLLTYLPKLETPHPDTIWFNQDEETISVERIHSIDEHFLTPPYQSDQKNLVLHRLDLASEIVQNLLLKKLEEPPTWLQIYITTSQPHLLLPTVLSRCEIVDTRSSSLTTHPSAVIAFNDLGKSVAEKIEVVKDLKQRHQAIDTILALLQLHIDQLHQQPSLTLIKNIGQLNKTLTLLQNNTNVKLAMEWCLFGLKTPQSKI